VTQRAAWVQRGSRPPRFRRPDLTAKDHMALSGRESAKIGSLASLRPGLGNGRNLTEAVDGLAMRAKLAVWQGAQVQIADP
jgi:hypothetical protein